tara:strand:- start:9431 stop:9943 length:513 start_codon:yes stop_codon:yes gene_type:complete
MFLNSFYVQKSKLLLYPLLQLPIDVIKPKTTYLAYKDKYGPKDYKLICAYKRENNEEYYKVRNEILFKNNFFIEHILGLEYDYLVFTIKKYSIDYDFFLKGEYSKLKPNTKRIILESYSSTKLGPALLDTHLNPENGHALYAKELMIDIEDLRLVYETLDPPDMSKEFCE